MRATELRIGNSILVNGVIIPEIGYGVITDVAQKNKGIKNSYLNTLTFSPIPLIEEILLKVGFKYYSSDIMRLDKGFYYIKSNNNIMKGQEILIKCEYLHQLQNLYFALTSEELNTAGLI